MKAIVLSYDRYHPFAFHTILTYERIWPNNPFTFRVPYNHTYPGFIKSKFGDKVELINTDIKIKDTVLKLIEDIDDEEWIYWCIDDRYLIGVKEEIINFLFNKVKDNEEINGIDFRGKRGACGGGHWGQIEGYNFIKRKNYRQIWSHQFMRCKCLRYLFENMPKIRVAKNMDVHVKNVIKLPFHNMILMDYRKHDRKIFETGESTKGGEIVYKCLKSLEKYEIEVPSDMEIYYTKDDLNGNPNINKRK